jgi:hypothetical protein
MPTMRRGIHQKAKKLTIDVLLVARLRHSIAPFTSLGDRYNSAAAARSHAGTGGGIAYLCGTVHSTTKSRRRPIR